jgi:hypothetical protein
MTGSRSFEPFEAESRKLIAEDPLAALEAITEQKHAILEQEREAVFRALDEGHSWRRIGEALGVSKQAAFQRFGPEWAVMTKASLPKSAWKQAIKQRLED